MLYKFVMAFHIIAVIAWMAGILYLYRLFVYHAEETESVVKERFTMMEGRLYRIILIPAMLVALLLGIAMLGLKPLLLYQPWLYLKIILVVGMLGLSHMGSKIGADLAAGTCKLSGRKLRFLNEAPTLLMIGIVLLVILKPFSTIAS